MDRYGPKAPDGDDRPSSQRDALAYWDNVSRDAKQAQRDLMRDFVGGADQSLSTVDWGQLAEDVVTLAGLMIRGVFMLVTWPVRWAWRRREQR